MWRRSRQDFWLQEEAVSFWFYFELGQPATKVFALVLVVRLASTVRRTYFFQVDVSLIRAGNVEVVNDALEIIARDHSGGGGGT